MAGWLSMTEARNRYLKISFRRAGFKSVLVDLGDGTRMHSWVPKKPKDKPALVLIHGVGANAMWQWGYQLNRFKRLFNLYIPDLVFFGKSFTTRGDRSEQFQAQCVIKMMEMVGVTQLSVVGLSYGGFVAYSMAYLYPHAVHRVVIVAAGVTLEEKDVSLGLFKVSDVQSAMRILLPLNVTDLKALISYAFARPPKLIPSCLLHDFISTMAFDRRQEKEELLCSIINNRKSFSLPPIPQKTLIVWGDRDQIFPLELADRLKRHLGDQAELVVLKGAGHALNMEKPAEFNKVLKSFLVDSKQS